MDGLPSSTIGFTGRDQPVQAGAGEISVPLCMADH